MTIEELEHKHFIIPEQAYKSSKQHTKLSIQFAINVLEEMEYNILSDMEICKFESKIQELKQYLDEIN